MLRSHLISIMFMFAATLWGAAAWWLGGGIYGAYGAIPGTAMTLMISLSYAAIVIASVVRSVRRHRAEWLLLALAVVAPFAANIGWQWVAMPNIDASKHIALILFKLQPLVAGLGIAAAYLEWRVSAAKAAG